MSGLRAAIAAVFAGVIAAGCASGGPGAASIEAPARDAALQRAVDGAWRTPEARARDAQRHPVESLTFWGLKPGMTIIDIEPGAGAWWTPILAPYAKETGGRYIAGFVDLGDPAVSQRAREARAGFQGEWADETIYGDVAVVDFGPHSGLGAADASADFILAARTFHGWARTEGRTDRFMAEFARVLKPGGVLAVEQHRAAEGADVSATAPKGYVPEAFIIAAAERAGLRFAGRSEINANVRDDRDHPFGVWTLAPVRRTSPLGQPDNPAFDRTEYDAIGESDRMTLKFVKPG
ncbi:MAG: class I SAM-dependent methyltransferase [Hyphomonadaceae bacterium]|nr:class I SAM-dependent methyltransferase [Hyphomonadaceae bacterium]